MLALQELFPVTKVILPSDFCGSSLETSPQSVDQFSLSIQNTPILTGLQGQSAVRPYSPHAHHQCGFSFSVIYRDFSFMVEGVYLTVKYLQYLLQSKHFATLYKNKPNWDAVQFNLNICLSLKCFMLKLLRYFVCFKMTGTPIIINCCSLTWRE